MSRSAFERAALLSASPLLSTNSFTDKQKGEFMAHSPLSSVRAKALTLVVARASEAYLGGHSILPTKPTQIAYSCLIRISDTVGVVQRYENLAQRVL